MRVLFICTGNSCRSQIAEGYLKHIAPELEVFSSGISPEQCISQYAVKAMSLLGIDISRQKPKSVNEFINDDFDFVITMSEKADTLCPEFKGKIINRLHLGFEDPAEAIGSDEVILNKYIQVRDLIINDIKMLYDLDISP